MPEFPTTRVSLLVRLRDTADQAAWEEFVSIYQPVIFRFARQRGLQQADAHDLAQEVLSAVAQRIPDWQPDQDRARFRTWLSRIASNQTVTMYRRRKPDAARGGTTAVAVLNSQADPATDLELNYRRESFRDLGQAGAGGVRRGDLAGVLDDGGGRSFRRRDCPFARTQRRRGLHGSQPHHSPSAGTGWLQRRRRGAR